MTPLSDDGNGLSTAEITRLAEGLAVALQDQLGFGIGYSETIAGFLAGDRDVHFAVQAIIAGRKDTHDDFTI